MRVVYYEGLGGRLGNFLKRGIIRVAKKKYPNVIYEQRFWTDDSDFKNPDILIGHSFGGARVLELFRDPIDWYNVKLILTLDPRWTSNSLFYAVPDVLNHVNIIQLCTLRGCKTYGSKEINLGHYGHLALARSPVPLKFLLDTLEKYS